MIDKGNTLTFALIGLVGIGVAHAADDRPSILAVRSEPSFWLYSGFGSPPQVRSLLTWSVRSTLPDKENLCARSLVVDFLKARC
mgnify:CR=1 FL=1